MSILLVAASLVLAEPSALQASGQTTVQQRQIPVQTPGQTHIDPPDMRQAAVMTEAEAFPGVDWLAGQPNTAFPGVDWSEMQVSRVGHTAFPGVDWRPVGHCQASDGAVRTVERYVPGRGRQAFERITVVGEDGLASAGENSVTAAPSGNRSFVGENGQADPRTIQNARPALSRRTMTAQSQTAYPDCTG
ncbi:hypothetical protein [Maricaulis sp.]|uniref:hypothetical protein n=1 Tax=Maricaulis sp. TaxID=1486257 RepID=UPI002B27BC08|nr:hypothetical protein [Maricaulis sp.]